MSEIQELPPYNPFHDYFGDLKDDEKYKDKDSGREYPYLKGLQRLAHTNRGGIKAVKSFIAKTPKVNTREFLEHCKDGDQEVQNTTKDIPDCIAACTVTYLFNDGTEFDGSADASYKAHDAPFNLHLTAVAESKAEARAIRRAFNIRQVSKEEIGLEESVLDSEERITDTQLHGLRKLSERAGMTEAELCSFLGVVSLEEMTTKEGAAAIKKVNRKK